MNKKGGLRHIYSVAIAGIILTLAGGPGTANETILMEESPSLSIVTSLGPLLVFGYAFGPVLTVDLEPPEIIRKINMNDSPLGGGMGKGSYLCRHQNKRPD